MDGGASSHEDEVVRFLRQKLQEAEAKLAVLEREIEPQRQDVRRLKASLASAMTGTFGSSSVTDGEIVNYVRENATQRRPLTAPEIASGLGLDTRGLSRRLPRMVNDGLLHGSPEPGYWA
jgi:CRP-like cAMP-binding protein